MWYLGSKSRISKYIVPIIQSYINENTSGYLEPFVGGLILLIKYNATIKLDVIYIKN